MRARVLDRKPKLSSPCTIASRPVYSKSLFCTLIGARPQFLFKPFLSLIIRRTCFVGCCRILSPDEQTFILSVRSGVNSTADRGPTLPNRTQTPRMVQYCVQHWPSPWAISQPTGTIITWSRQKTDDDGRRKTETCAILLQIE